MTAEEAIQQMDMLGHSFFMFRNADTGGICVVYLRRDEDIGMLEPTNQ
jgi:putative sigma-54 modulation protein